MNEIDKKIKISNKIYPYISGLSDDLLFWAAINTIFLTTVKMLSASQVSLLSAIAGLVTILSQSLVLKIIKKLGNIKSVRLGLLMLLIGATLITFGNNFSIIMVGEIFYNMAFLFKGMDSIILRRNLKYLKSNRIEPPNDTAEMYNFQIVSVASVYKGTIRSLKG